MQKMLGVADPKETERNAKHEEVEKIFKKLCNHLDALSNFHFTPRIVCCILLVLFLLHLLFTFPCFFPLALFVTADNVFFFSQPEPEIKVVHNVPAIHMEEVTPVTFSDASALAPEEIYQHNKKHVKVITITIINIVKSASCSPSLLPLFSPLISHLYHLCSLLPLLCVSSFFSLPSSSFYIHLLFSSLLQAPTELSSAEKKRGRAQFKLKVKTSKEQKEAERKLREKLFPETVSKKAATKRAVQEIATAKV